jgi:hypothetical protein
MFKLTAFALVLAAIIFVGFDSTAPVQTASTEVISGAAYIADA